MSKTDQAFIDAYRRQAPRAVEPTRKPASTVKQHIAHGPHLRFTGGAKAPLSEVMQTRAGGAPEAIEATPTPVADGPIANTEVHRFTWPGVVDELVSDSAADFGGLVGGVLNEWPMLGMVGCRLGSATTTNTMVLARLIAAQEARVAVIDADPITPSLAAGLGLLRHKTLADVLATGAPIAEAAVHAVGDNISLMVAGPVTQHPAVLREALLRLRQTHDAVLIDLGSDPRRLMLHADAVALVHPHDESDAVIEYSCRSLAQASAPLVGTIQTLAPAA